MVYIAIVNVFYHSCLVIYKSYKESERYIMVRIIIAIKVLF